MLHQVLLLTLEYLHCKDLINCLVLSKEWFEIVGRMLWRDCNSIQLSHLLNLDYKSRNFYAECIVNLNIDSLIDNNRMLNRLDALWFDSLINLKIHTAGMSRLQALKLQQQFKVCLVPSLRLIELQTGFVCNDFVSSCGDEGRKNIQLIIKDLAPSLPISTMNLKSNHSILMKPNHSILMEPNHSILMKPTHSILMKPNHSILLKTNHSGINPVIKTIRFKSCFSSSSSSSSTPQPPHHSTKKFTKFSTLHTTKKSWNLFNALF